MNCVFDQFNVAIFAFFGFNVNVKRTALEMYAVNGFASAKRSAISLMYAVNGSACAGFCFIRIYKLNRVGRSGITSAGRIFANFATNASFLLTSGAYGRSRCNVKCTALRMNIVLCSASADRSFTVRLRRKSKRE